MALRSRFRVQTPFAGALDLPPPFRAIALREAGDAFAHASAIAGEEGAGTLVHVGRFDLAEFAVVLEPDEPLRTARRALYAGAAALLDALAVQAPPETPIHIAWPDAIMVDGGLVGGVRLGWPPGAAEDAAPPWLVFAALIRTATGDGEVAGLRPLASAYDDEGVAALDCTRLIESFARHLMVDLDAWQRDGFGEVARSYLSRFAVESGVRRAIDDNGDLLVRRTGKAGAERRALAPALAQPSWLDPATGAPRSEP